MKNFTKQNFKTNPLWIRLLIMAFMVLAGVGNLSAAQYNIHWNGKVYFLAPETWNVDETYKYIQVDITRTTSATSSNHQEYIGNMTRLGTSRLFYVSVNANHNNWNQNEYIAFTANDHNYGSGSFRIDNNHYYTTPLDYGVKDGGYYLFKPNSKTELQTTTNANKITGIWASNRDDFKVDQTVQIYTNGSSSATGGTVKLTGYYLSSDNALSSSSETSSSTSAKYGSVPGTEMKLTATAKTGYKFDGWYTAATGGTKLSSDATYTYNVYEETTVYARFLSKEYTITYKDQGGANFSGTHANGYPTKHTYGTATTLKSPTKTGYNFLGWFTTSACNGSAVTSLGATAYTANITLYAKWEKACTPADVQITSGPSDICPGGSTTFTYTAAAGANITWKMESASSAFAFTDNNGTVTVRHSNPSTIVNGANKILYTVTDANDICPASNVDTEKTITLLSVPSITASTSTTQNICYGTKATLTVTSGQGTYTWENSNGGEAIDSKTNSVTVSKAGTYTVTAQNAGGCTSDEITFTVTVKSQIAAPTLNPNSATVCSGDAFKLPNIDGVTWSLDGKPTTGSQPGIANNTDAAIIKTFQAVKEVDGCPSAPADYIVTVNPTPVITGESVAQPGKANAINLKLQDNLVADWSVDPTADFSYTTNINSTAFSAETNGTYTITATTKDGCSDTHVVTVADAFYVYMRQPKKGETAYDNFYYPTQNPTQGGDLFYKEYASIPPAEGYTDYNEGGVAHDIKFTDCDGYVWYGFKASDKLIDGTNYFTVRAPNLGGNGGYYTHTYLTKPGAMTSDIYYTMNENASGVSQGWYITKVDAPYAGPKVHASGNDFSFNKNNFADFVALYVTDCSGKEIESYQWYKDGEAYVSECEYSIVEKNKTTKLNEYKTVTGDAGKTNNIRPNAAGNYTCKVTYKGGTSATSAAFYVNATSGETKADFKSNLPVIMVNTGSKNFPSCPAANETASKNAEKMKKKLSVDVKILFDGNIVYDRKARMAYRGSSSLNFQKKSYAFCPGDANCGDKDKGEDYVKTAKLNMLGIGDACDKDWVLYAAAADPSMLRNRMVFETYQAMRPGDWGVHSRYVELIINGEYKGVYVMMDKITQNEKRVNVKWDVDDATKRGFILKFDKTDIPDRSVDYPDGDEKTFLSKYSGKYDITTYDAQVDQAFEIEYPEKEDIQDDGGNWYEVINFIKGKVNEFETALSAGDYATVQQIIDYESWADWFILSEYTKNVDAFRASCVFVYDGNKIKATPLWDQELSFNNQSVHANRHTGDGGNKGCQDATGLLIKHSGVYSDNFAAPFWFTGQLAGGKGTEKLAAKTFTGALLNDQCFVQMVKNRWAAHKEGALSNASLTALITEYEKELTEAVRTREANFWTNNGYSRNTLSCPWGGNSTGYYDDSYADAKGHITAWINDDAAKEGSSSGRRAGLDEAIEDLKGTGLDIAIKPASILTTPWVPVVIQVQNETGYEYTLTYTDGSLDQVKDLIIERSGDTYKYHIPRPWSAGNEQQEGEREDINYGIKATLQVGEGNNQCGSSTELPSATATITLQDEPNEICQ